VGAGVSVVVTRLTQLMVLAGVLLAASSCTPSTEGYVRLSDVAREMNLSVEREAIDGRVMLRRPAGARQPDAGARPAGVSGLEVVLSPGVEGVLVNGDFRRLPRPTRYSGGEVLVAQELRAALRSVTLFPPSRPLTRVRAVRKVVLDPGHGGHDPGALGRGGLREKDVNLDIALRLAQRLRERGIEVVLTRTTDVFISLEERSRIANREQPDLFLAIHADASPRASTAGATSYLVKEVFEHAGLGTVTLDERAGLAARETSLNPTHVRVLPSSATLALVLWQVMLSEYRRESRLLAEGVQRHLAARTGQPDRGVQEAAYAVLKWTYTPAVLIEVGFLSNPTWEAQLASPDYRERTAQAIADAVSDFDRDLTLGLRP
jgi:N-acetylmuramoyl-L-alanine amidase